MSRDDEFTEFVTARWSRLVRTAVLLGCSPAEAEDITQAALERCLAKWGTVQRASDRDAYVHRVLINTFTSARRRYWTRERPTAALPEGAVVDHAPGVEEADAVTRALAQLSDDQRTAVVLRYYVHLSEQQMATALGVAPGTVKSRLARALKILSHDQNLQELRGIR